jgi:hypothetical protein
MLFVIEIDERLTRKSITLWPLDVQHEIKNAVGVSDNFCLGLSGVEEIIDK